MIWIYKLHRGNRQTNNYVSEIPVNQTVHAEWLNIKIVEKKESNEMQLHSYDQTIITEVVAYNSVATK